MHFLPLSLKRAHWASIKMLKPLAARFGLTPARFDLLYCAVRMRGVAYQARLARELGVSRATVCKMLDGLEEAGIIVRLDRNVFDKRHVRWNLTELGRDCFRGLLKVIRRRIVELGIVHAIARRRSRRDAAAAEMLAATNAAENVAWSFDDDLPCNLFPYDRDFHRAQRAVRRRAAEAWRAQAASTRAA